MQTLYNPLDASDPFYSKDFKDMIQENFINPLANLGITFKSNQTITDEESGIHILKFKSHAHDLNTIRSITGTEDEGFNSQAIFYYDDLYLSITFEL